MGKYTLYAQSRIDEKIQEHLDIAVKELKKIKNIQSAILVGGFGRAEGSVKLEKDGVLPLNDYDIYIIVSQKISDQEILKIAKRIEEQTGSSGFSMFELCPKDFYFDIRAIHIKDLPKLLPFIKYYEMKHASYVLFGSDLRHLIPDYEPQDLPLSEGMRFLCNRLSSIFNWPPVKYIKGLPVERWEKDVLLYDVSKAYCACCTALCQLAGVYAPTYQKRLENLTTVYDRSFPQLEKQIPDLLEKIRFYTYLKLKPDYQNIQDYKERWFEARADLLEVIRFFIKDAFGAKSYDEFLEKTAQHYLNPYLKIKFSNSLGFSPPSVFLPLLNRASQIALNLIWVKRLLRYQKRLFLRSLLDTRDPGLRIFSSLIFIVQALNPDGSIDKKLFIKGQDILSKVYPLEKKGGNSLEDFEKLHKDYIDAWKLYFFMKLG